MTSLFCGIDWSDDHHDVAIVDRPGSVLAERRISNDPCGVAALVAMFGRVRRDRGPLDAGGDRGERRPVDETPKDAVEASGLLPRRASARLNLGVRHPG